MDWATAEHFKEYLLAELPKVFRALLALLIGVLLSTLARRWLGAFLNRSRIRGDALLKDFFLRALSISIVLVAVMAALSNFLNVGSFLAGLGLTGLIIGFGLRDTVSNFASGLLLLVYRPFRAGELIEIEGTQGIVVELTIVNMEMISTDGVRVIMPNSKVWGAKIVNYSIAKNRRAEFAIKVPTGKIEPSIQAIQVALAKDNRVLKEPAPVINITSVAGDFAQLTIWAWAEPGNLASLTADAYRGQLAALEQAGIAIG